MKEQGLFLKRKMKQVQKEMDNTCLPHFDPIWRIGSVYPGSRI